MANVLIVFGSKSDETVFNPISEELMRLGVEHDVRVCSAHRTPEELKAVLSPGYKVVITGAGLAAHLPGVVASKLIVPIIGVPVNSNYEGLDSLLSIMQMPPGIPVLSVGVGQAVVAARQAALMLNSYSSVHIRGEEDSPAVQKATAILEQFGVPYELNPDFEANSLTLHFVPLDEQPEVRDDLIIYIPTIAKGEDNALAALNLLKHTTSGLWVGLNRGENAALAAVKILNIHGAYTEKLIHYRKTQAQKVMKDDESVRKK